MPPSARANRPSFLASAPVKAPLVAEELRLEQRLGDRAAVHLDEGPIPAGAERVQRVGDQFLARAARPLDEHGGGARRDLLHHSKHGGDGPALPDDAAERHVGSVVELLPEPAVVGRQRLFAERPRHHPLEVGSLEWLRDKVVGGALDGLHGERDAPEAGEQHDLRLRPKLTGALDHLQAVEVGQPEVGQHQLVCLLPQEGKSFGRRPGRVDAVAQPRHDLRHRDAQGFFVVDDEDARAHLVTTSRGADGCGEHAQGPDSARDGGSVMVNLVPPPRTRSRSRTSPPLPPTAPCSA